MFHAKRIQASCGYFPEFPLFLYIIPDTLQEIFFACNVTCLYKTATSPISSEKYMKQTELPDTQSTESRNNNKKKSS